MLLEVCVDFIQSAINAEKGGAGRIELCSALSEGGLTPTLGTLKTLKKLLTIPIIVMIRPRRGDDFNYSELELDSMIEDILEFRKAEADGFVFGCLSENKEIDLNANTRLISAASGLPCTFHRAFDVTRSQDMMANYKLVETLGFKRILTSGFECNALGGLNNIKQLMNEGNLIVMPGAGISAQNLETIIRETRCKEFHASARKPLTKTEGKISMGGGAQDLEPLLVCCENIVEELVKIAKSI